MALAEKLSPRASISPTTSIIDHFTYVFLGDGCMMEGISHEACSLAGTLGLGKLIAVYDDNGISIDSDKGEIHQWYTDDARRRFDAYGWHVVGLVDGHDVEAVDKALKRAKREKDRPTLIIAKTTIAKGAPKKANTGAAHGAPLGAEEMRPPGWPSAGRMRRSSCPSTSTPAGTRARPARKPSAAGTGFSRATRSAFPEEAAELERRVAPPVRPTSTPAYRRSFPSSTEGWTLATRKASQNVLDTLVVALPELVGGSADLTGSNLTWAKGSAPVLRSAPAGNHIFYGVREFGMCAVMNGLALHGGLRAVQRGVPRLLRLRAQRPSPAALMRHSGDLRLLARLHRPERGRPHAPADRARGDLAPDAQYGGLAPVRQGSQRSPG